MEWGLCLMNLGRGTFIGEGELVKAGAANREGRPGVTGGGGAGKGTEAGGVEVRLSVGHSGGAAIPGCRPMTPTSTK